MQLHFTFLEILAFLIHSLLFFLCEITFFWFGPYFSDCSFLLSMGFLIASRNTLCPQGALTGSSLSLSLSPPVGSIFCISVCPTHICVLSFVLDVKHAILSYATGYPSQNTLSDLYAFASNQTCQTSCLSLSWKTREHPQQIDFSLDGLPEGLLASSRAPWKLAMAQFL